MLKKQGYRLQVIGYSFFGWGNWVENHRKTLWLTLTLLTQSTDRLNYLASKVLFMRGLQPAIAQFIDTPHRIKSPLSTPPTKEAKNNNLLEGVVMSNVFRSHWPLLIDNSLKIVNCKLSIAAPQGGAR